MSHYPKIPDYSTWESVTKRAFYRGQVQPIGRWVRGVVLDAGSNYGRFSSLSESTISLDIDKRSLTCGIELGNIRSAVVGSAVDLAFKRERFDSVLAIEVTAHTPRSSLARLPDELT